MTIEPGTRWRRKRDGQEVTIISVAGQFSVTYKATSVRPNASHAATAVKRRHLFEKEFVPVVAEQPPTLFSAPSGREQPAAMPTDLNAALAAIASQIRLRARTLVSYEGSENDQRRLALEDVAESIEEFVDGCVLDRSMFLSWDVVGLLVRVKLAANDYEARSAIVDGLVYIDGQQVESSDAPITRATRDRFAIRCGDQTKIVKVVG